MKLTNESIDPPVRAYVVNQSPDVVIKGIDMKFGDMVNLVLKFWAATAVAWALLAILGFLIWLLGVVCLSGFWNIIHSK